MSSFFKTKQFQTIVFFIILLLAAGIRLYKLGSVPPSPYLDEVSNGYNAYSLLKTGNDEYGRHLPLLLQAYNDFRPALFVYTLIPFIKLFGLTLFAIRLPAVLLSVLTTLAVFFLTKGMFNVQKTQNTRKTRKSDIQSFRQSDNTGARSFLSIPSSSALALLAAFLFAISPWSIYSSHISDEINMSLSFFVYGLTFFFCWQNQKEALWKRFFFIASIVCFVIAFYAYHGIKIFLPFFIMTLVVIHYKDLLRQKKLVLFGGMLAVVLLMPLYFALHAPGATVRLDAVNIYTQQPELVRYGATKLLHDTKQGDVFGKIFDNRRVLVSLLFLKNSLSNLDPTWLFFGSENKTFRIPDFGPFYLCELPFIFFGVYFLIKEEGIDGRVKILLFLWIILSIIPSGISSESPHLNRTNTMLPALTIVQAAGLYFLLRKIYSQKNRLLQIPAYGFLVVVILGSFLWFSSAYFTSFPYFQAKAYQYGAIQALEFAAHHDKTYDSITVSSTDTLLQSYMYYLFTTKYDPATYQKQGGTKSAFFNDDHRLGKYFSPVWAV